MSSTRFPTVATAEASLALIDALIERLQDSPDPMRSLIREHLQSARGNMQGGMPAECAHNFELAKNAARMLTDKELRHDLLGSIASLQSELAHELVSHEALTKPTFQSPGTTDANLEHFFKKSDSSFGVFYPTHCIIAILPSLRDAVAVGAMLVDCGLDKHDVLVARGSQIVRFFSHPSTLGAVMAPISRLFGTEQQMVDRSLELARKDAGFVAIHVAHEQDAHKIGALLLPFEPLNAWFYEASGIQSLV